MHPESIVKASQIAAALGCSRATVYRLWASGELPRVGRNGSRWADVLALGGRK